MPGTRRKEQASRLIRFYALALLIAVLDQISKYLILSRLVTGQSIPVIEGVFHLTLVRNTGIAFGLFQGHETLLFFLITVSILFLLGFSAALGEEDRGFRLSLALILGGAVGNWIDRLLHQAVIDFLDLRIWPVFNIADSAITAGVLLYLLLFLLGNRHRAEGAKKQ